MNILDWIILAVVIAGAVIAIFGWDRYRDTRRAAGDGNGARPTDEVFIDPETGSRTRVWYNPATGQRDYRPG